MVGLDNFSTGYSQNLTDVKKSVEKRQWSNFCFFEGDIRDFKDCERVLVWHKKESSTDKRYDNIEQKVDFVLHNAAIGSVKKSIEDPVTTNEVNINGFLNILVASRNAGVKRFVYATSSATYGNDNTFPKIESKVGEPLSPYAITKLVNELYAKNFFSLYNFNSIGLRYFNIFGCRQDSNSSYAAVIPRWFDAMLSNEPVYIFGDGKNTRDFCHVQDVVNANILAASSGYLNDELQVYNIAGGNKTSLNKLFKLMRKVVIKNDIHYDINPIYQDRREGDIKHSHACIDKAVNSLGFNPKTTLEDGLTETFHWYRSKF